MKHALRAFILVPLMVPLSNCGPLKEGLSQVVLMDYDQVNNYRNYEFEPNFSIDWGGGASEYGVGGGWENTSGFWVSFLICNLRNEGSNAQTFPYQASNFYVDYDGKQHFYKPLETYTYHSLPHNLPGNPSVNPLVNQRLRLETQLGPDTDSFQKGYYPHVNYRISIYVQKTSPGVLAADIPLLLRYQGYPNILSPRNQPPAYNAANPTKKQGLGTTCRPPAG